MVKDELKNLYSIIFNNLNYYINEKLNKLIYFIFIDELYDQFYVIILSYEFYFIKIY